MRSFIVILCLFCIAMVGCRDEQTASSGVTQQSVALQPGSSGRTVEQDNIAARLIEDNLPGAIKHLYVISAYSGQVILYSTVKGKVTSGGKSLSPKLRRAADTQGVTAVDAIGDDGSFGQAVEYLYWWDTRGIYHQHYVSGGQIVHISSQPVAVKSVIINLASEG